MSVNPINTNTKKALTTHGDLYNFDADDFSKLFLFDSFSKEDIRFIIAKHSIDLTVSEIENLKIMYKNMPPTILELKTIGKYWKTSQSLLKTSIEKIEIKSNNKHIKDTLLNINLLRKKQQNALPLSLDAIFNLYKYDFQLKSINNTDVYSDNLQTLKCSAFTSKEKVLCEISSFSSFSLNDNNSLYRSTIKAFERGFDILSTYRKDLNKNTSLDTLEYRKKAFKAWVSSISTSSLSEDNKMSYFDVTTVLGFSNSDNIRDFDISEGDKIFMINFSNSDEALYETLYLSFEGLFRKYNAFVVLDDNSSFFNLVNVTTGFIINIESLSIELYDFLFSDTSRTTTIIVKKDYANDFIKASKSKSLDCLEIGIIKNSNHYEMQIGNNKVFSINSEVLHKKPHQSIIAIIDESSECNDSPIIGANYKELALKGLENYDIKNPNKVLNPFLCGKALVGPYSGHTQLTPSQVFCVSPSFFIMKDLKVGTATSELHNYSDANFSKTIDILTRTLLKLITIGYPIHQIFLELLLFNNKDDKSLQLGEFISAALACFCFQRHTSVPIIKPIFKFLDTSTENSHIYANGFGYTNGRLANNTFKKGDKIFKLTINKNNDGLPDFKKILNISSIITMNIEVGNITAATFVEKNTVNSIILNCLNGFLGFSFSHMGKYLFHSDDYEILLAINDISEITTLDLDYVGVVDGSGIIRSTTFQITMNELLRTINLKNFIYERFKEERKVLPIYKLETTTKSKLNSSTPQALIISFDRHSTNIYSNILHEIGFNVNQRLLLKPFTITDNLIRNLRDAITASNMILITGDIPMENEAYYTYLIKILKTPSILDAINETLHSFGSLVFGSGIGSRILFELGFLEKGTSEAEPMYLKPLSKESYTNKLYKFSIINNNNLWLKGVNIDLYNGSEQNEYSTLKLSNKSYNNFLSSGQIIAQKVDMSNLSNYDSYSYPELTKDIVGVLSPQGQVCSFIPSIEKVIFTSKKNYDLLFNIFSNTFEYFTKNL